MEALNYNLRFQLEGVRVRIGERHGEDLLSIQAIDFSKDNWTVVAAQATLRSDSFWPVGFEEVGNSWRFHMNHETEFKPGTLKIVETDPSQLLGDMSTTKPKEIRFTFDEGNEEFKLIEEADLNKYKKDKLKSISDVEIFSTGTWNGDEYTKDDLDDMVKAFDKVGFQVPITLGHDNKSGSPAFGWVDSIIRKGKKLVATFRDIPKNLYDAIKERRFDAVSAEIFWNLERDGKTFRRVLKAVALLGGETPGVSHLAPLRTVVNSFDNDIFERVLVYTIPYEELDVMDLKELQDTVQKLTEDLEVANKAKVKAEVKAKDGDEKATAKLKEAEDQVETLTTKLKDAQTSIAKLAEDQEKSSSEKDEQIATLTKSIEDLTSSMATMQERDRKKLIDEKVNEVPIPALHPIFRPLYEIASTTAKVAMFSVTGKKEDEKETPIMEILDSLVTHLKSDAMKLFREVAKSETQGLDDPNNDATQYDNDPSAEVDKRARKYMDEHDDATYVQAAEHVLKDDPELKVAYAAFSTGPSVN